MAAYLSTRRMALHRSKCALMNKNTKTTSRMRYIIEDRPLLVKLVNGVKKSNMALCA